MWRPFAPEARSEKDTSAEDYAENMLTRGVMVLTMRTARPASLAEKSGITRDRDFGQTKLVQIIPSKFASQLAGVPSVLERYVAAKYLSCEVPITLSMAISCSPPLLTSRLIWCRYEYSKQDDCECPVYHHLSNANKIICNEAHNRWLRQWKTLVNMIKALYLITSDALVFCTRGLWVSNCSAQPSLQTSLNL